MVSVRRLLHVLLAACLLMPTAGATWSIILVNVRTGEIAIGCATCLTALDLAATVPVLLVGKGGAAAQSVVDSSGQNRIYIWTELGKGTPLDQILQGLAQRDPQHQSRQYGMVSVRGEALGFTGSAAGSWAGHVTGQLGDVAYAIQGNVLTGQNVVKAAEVALWVTPGDLPQRLMAMMQAARAFGGDGRCSCNRGPTFCGSPPPSFTKSAHIGFMIVGRIGDRDGSCNSGGCANGSYYMRLNVANQSAAAPDPVLQLQTLFDAWAASQRGRPDHHLSTVEVPNRLLPADGLTTTAATVVLRDRDGTRIPTGGALVTVALDPTSPATVSFGTVRDNGDGTYTIPITAGATTGIARFRVTVDDGKGARLLSPQTELELIDTQLWASHARLSARDGGKVDFVLDAGTKAVGLPWILLASDTGTAPGLVLVRFPPVLLQLNPGPVFFATLNAAFNYLMPELVGIFPASGRATTSLTFPPGSYGLAPGTDLHFAYLLGLPTFHTSRPVKVELR